MKEGKVGDIQDLGITEFLSVKRQVLVSASMILKVDDIWSVEFGSNQVKTKLIQKTPIAVVNEPSCGTCFTPNVLSPSCPPSAHIAFPIKRDAPS